MGTHPEVPLLDLQAQYETLRSEMEEAVRSVFESQRFILGDEVRALEQEIAAYCDAPHAIGCASGSDALLLALMALDVGPGDQVLLPTYTFFATAGSVARLGAEPVFVDIDPATYNVDPDSLARAASGCSRLAAVMPVHLYGQVCDLDALERFAGERGLPIIEDAAQAIGARDAEGRAAGSRPNIACFSFFPSKNLGGAGDGGMITCHDEALADKLAVLRVHGSKPKYHHQLVGINSRLDALQAAVLRVKLRHLERWHLARAENADRYEDLFRKAGAVDSRTPLADGGLPLRVPSRPAPPARHVFNQYVLRVPAQLRDPLREHLGGQGVGSEVYYPIPLHAQACFQTGQPSPALPVSEAAALETIAIPIYPELRAEQIEHVATCTVDFLERNA